MGFVLQNFCWGLLEAEVMDNVTSIELEDLSRFPTTMTPANPLALTISDGRQDPEIVYCTGISGDFLTVLRGQEGTVPKVWPAASKIWAMLTAAVIQNFGAVEADQVSFSPAAGISSTNVQAAIEEVVADVAAALTGYQPLDAMLTALAGLVTANNKGLYFTGPDAPVQYDLSPFARTILDDADAAAVRATLVLGALAVLNTVGTGQIDDDAVTLAKITNIATASFLGRSTAGTGDPEVLTVAQAKTLLNLTGTNSGDQTITLTGDVTGSGTGSFAATIANNAVTNAKAADMTQQTIKGRAVGAGTGDPTDLTSAQATAILDVFTSGLKGLAPASGGGTTNFLRADGTWAAAGASNSVAIWSEEYANNTNAGSSVDSVWTKRTLNTERANNTGGVTSLASSVMTFSSGKWLIFAETTFYNCTTGYKTRLRNTTDSVNLGQSRTGTNTGLNVPDMVVGYLDASAGSKNVELQYYTGTAITNGLGLAGAPDTETEIYTQVFALKIG